MRILIIEDDEVLQSALETGLQMNGFTIDAVGTAADARAAARDWSYDAIVLDIGLPDGSGLDLLTGWRTAGSNTPVLLLTARNTVYDRIGGLDVGADDYLGKPFDLREVAARLRAISRRAQGRTVELLEWRGITLDLSAREARKGGALVSLGRREFAVLQTMMEQPGIVFSKAQLEDRLYGWQEEIGSNAIEVHVHNLRAKLGRDLIETIRGEGYRVPRP